MWCKINRMTLLTWFTRAEAAAYLRVTPKTIDRYVERGQLVKFTIADGRSTRYRKEHLDALLKPMTGDVESYEGVVRQPEWEGERAPCGCPAQGDFWLCSIGGPWTPKCPSWSSYNEHWRGQAA